MFEKEKIREVIKSQDVEFKEVNLGIPRFLLEKISLTLSHAIILSGIRRSGKSTLLRQLWKKVKKGYYCNFEDSRLYGFTLTDFETLDTVFHEENGDCSYYFFDEIQAVPQWERLVRGLLDRGKKCFITGSNASLLSSELGTLLTGRHLTYEVFPFSYEEWCQFTKEKQGKKSVENYISLGGFPEFLQQRKAELLQELLQDIFARDIIVRYGLRDHKILRELGTFLLTSVGKPFSYNKLAKYLHVGSINTIINYIGYMEECYMLFTISQYAFSYKKQLISEKKAYVIDSGFGAANAAGFSQDLGRLFENIVFLHLRRKCKEIYYFKGKNECDFLIRERASISMAVQACALLHQQNLEREINGLKEAMKTYKIPKGVIITLDQEDKREDIEIIPFWKWSIGK